MKKSKLGVLNLLLVIFMLFFLSCNNDTSGNSEKDTTKTMNNNITLTRLAGETSSVEPEKRIEVRFKAVNIPTTKASDDDSLVLVGYYLCDSNVEEYSWNNNDTSGEGVPTSTEFVKSVENGSVSFTFYYDAGNDNTDFKIYDDGTWDDVIVDPNSSDGNIKIDFTDFALPGDVVEVVLDASLEAAE